MNVFRRINRLVFGTYDFSIVKDYRFWLLLIGLNTGGNLGFNYLFPEQTVLIFLFLLLCCTIEINKDKLLNASQIIFVSVFMMVFLMQALYLTIFATTTTIHYILLIAVGVMLVASCGKRFSRYFASIIFIYAVISLICYTIVMTGGSIPYYKIEDSNLDGGTIMRVYNFYYTQLGNPMAGLSYGLRNCGPFWEPGAFQGFLNLSLWFELTMSQVRNVYWKTRVIILIVTILTTLSTGGYVALFFILMFYFTKDVRLHVAYRIFFPILFLTLSYYLYDKLDFMGAKIETGGGRLDFSFQNFPNLMYAVFGYGYATESFSQSSMSSASSVFNLFRYMGIVGFGAYMIPLFMNKTYHKMMYALIVTIILMNEPFLSNAQIWWGMPFVVYDAMGQNKNVKRHAYLRHSHLAKR